MFGAAVVFPGQAALGIVVLLALHRVTHSFAFAGAGVAASTVGVSLSGLAQGRLIDRRGIRVIAPVTGVCAAAVAAICLALESHAPAAVLIALAAVLGASIPTTAPALRAVWSSLLDDRDERATAFAYMSLAQDVGFVLGPAVFAAVTVTVSPELALAGCWGLIAIGGLASATVSVPPGPLEPQGGQVASLLRSLASVAAVLAIFGIALDAIDVSTAAFASEHHHPQLAGVLLACFSIGSIAGALVYGSRAWRSDLRTRLMCCTAALGILALGPVAAPNIPLGAAAFVLAGIPVGTTLSTAFLLAAQRAPSGRQTEAYALLSLALNAGAALGGVLAGQIVASGSAGHGFLLAVACGLLGTIVLALPTVRQRRAR
jgi:MFS family permease